MLGSIEQNMQKRLESVIGYIVRQKNIKHSKDGIGRQKSTRNKKSDIGKGIKTISKHTTTNGILEEN